VAFYIAKGLQIGGLAGTGLALWVGITGADMATELLFATIGLGLFYLGRRIEP